MPHKTIVHLPLSVGGTLLTSAANTQHDDYVEAIRRYRVHGVADLVLCDDAYFGTTEERWAVRQAERYKQPCVTQYSQRVPHYFSVHCLNFDEVPNRSLEPFWRILDEVQKSTHPPRAPAPSHPRPTSHDVLWWVAALVAALVCGFGTVWLGAVLWRFFVN